MFYLVFNLMGFEQMNDELLVGAVAMGIAALFTLFSLGPWQFPYRMLSVAAIESRFGKKAARSFWLLIALLIGVVGLSILSGARPGYAKPDLTTEIR
jgi:hypothetical protein